MQTLTEIKQMWLNLQTAIKFVGEEASPEDPMSMILACELQEKGPKPVTGELTWADAIVKGRVSASQFVEIIELKTPQNQAHRQELRAMWVAKRKSQGLCTSFRCTNYIHPGCDIDECALCCNHQVKQPLPPGLKAVAVVDM